MVELINVLRAKSKEAESYLLKDHIRDTLEKLLQIWGFVNKNRDNISYDIIKDEETFKNLAKALFLHDLGKIDYEFQHKVFSKEERNNENDEWRIIKEFFTLPEEKYPKKYGISDHEILSVIHTVAFLGNKDWDKKIRTAILLHHNNKYYIEREQHITRILDDYPGVKDYLEFILDNREEFKKIYQGLINYIRDSFKKINDSQIILDALDEITIDLDKFDDFKKQIDLGFSVSNILSLYELYDKEEKEIMDFFVFLGLLRRCDYAASAGPNVNVEKPYSIIKDVMNELPKNIKNKLKIDRMWQEEIIEKHKNNNNLILIAPTGSGKTEFALLWAMKNGKKVIYTLPLRVALNDLFKRFSAEDGYFKRDYVDLLHSTSFIEYLRGEQNGEDLSISGKIKDARMLSSPILLSTPDQVLLSSLKYYGFDKILSIYPMATVIIDEIQAYDPEMAAIIIKSLKMIEKLQGNILIITATFPPYYYEFLQYPKVDVAKEDINIKNRKVKRHRIHLIEDAIFEKNEGAWNIKRESKDVIEGIIKREHPNENVLIIVNNVMKAIELYKMYENISDCNTEFLHSRLMEKEKRNRIEKIKKFLKDKKEEKIPKEKRIIVISTQLVEASVDFDFDVLITEISPIDSQIQRWGRVWRNREEESKNGDYDKSAPNVYTFTGIDEGTKAIYTQQEVLEKTVEVLKNYSDTLLGYEEEREMVEHVYTDENILNIYKQKIDETLKWLDIYQASKRSEAQRIFRKLAGVNIVIPQLMDSDNEYVSKLAKILENVERHKSWKEINEYIFGENASEDTKLKILMWMYEYSIPVPEYALRGYLQGHVCEFMGFYVLNIKPEKSDNIRNYGIDILQHEDLDEWLERKSIY